MMTALRNVGGEIVGGELDCAAEESELQFPHDEVRDHLEVPDILCDDLAAVMQRGRPDQQIRERKDNAPQCPLAGDCATALRNALAEVYRNRLFAIGATVLTYYVESLKIEYPHFEPMGQYQTFDARRHSPDRNQIDPHDSKDSLVSIFR